MKTQTVHTGGGVEGGTASAAALAAAVLLPPPTLEPLPAIGMRIFRPKEEKRSSKFFVRLASR